jgi:pyrroline-5-carboxylate reductase
MAQAIIGGLLRAKKAVPASLRVVEIDSGVRERVLNEYPGVQCHAKVHGAIGNGDIILLAVKPQQMKAAVKNLGIEANAHLVISIAAGITLTALGRWLSGQTRSIRAMPNTPALIGAGITALYSIPHHVSDADIKNAETIMSAIGKTVIVGNEDEMNAVTAISGSGPAYVFLFMEAIEQAAAELRLPKDIARELVLQTFIGSTKLAAESPDRLEVLRERVTSKGGTTEAALKSMAADHVKEAIIRAVKSANARSRELGDELGKD